MFIFAPLFIYCVIYGIQNYILKASLYLFYYLLLVWYEKIINNNITIIIPNKYTRLQDYKMNNIDIIKKRLKDIKQLSENLKTSSMRASREE